MSNAKMAADCIRRELKRMEHLKFVEQILDDVSGFENAHQNAKDSAERELSALEKKIGEAIQTEERLRAENAELARLKEGQAERLRAFVHEVESETETAKAEMLDSAAREADAMLIKARKQADNIEEASVKRVAILEEQQTAASKELEDLDRTRSELTEEVNALETKLNKIRKQLADMMGSTDG